jgi:hypothetical protein
MNNPSINYKAYFEQGVDYDQYAQGMRDKAQHAVVDEMDVYIPMNVQRSNRLERRFELGVEATNYLSVLSMSLKWLVISEWWCGDSSQILPVLNAMAQCSNGKIDLKMIYRDEHPMLMDAHLTNGSRSIPKLLILNENYQLLADWGPRPAEAQKLVKQLKSHPDTAGNYSEALHLWYARDKQAAIVGEILKLIMNISQH